MVFTANNSLMMGVLSIVGLLMVIVFLLKMKAEQDAFNQEVVKKINSLSESTKKTIVTTNDIRQLTEKLEHETSKIRGKVSKISHPQPTVAKVPLKPQSYIQEMASEDSDIEVEDNEDEETIMMKAVNML